VAPWADAAQAIPSRGFADRLLSALRHQLGERIEKVPVL